MEKNEIINLISDKKEFLYADKNEKRCNIGYGLDNNACRTTGVSIVSVCKNNPQMKFSFHLLCSNDLSKENIEKFALVAQEYHVDIIIYILNDKYPILSKLATETVFPLPTWYRIFFPQIIDVDRLLYLDTDIICKGSIEELFELDMKDSIVGVVADFETVRMKKTKQLGLDGHIYFNAGMLLIDLYKWREQALTDELLRLVKENRKLLDQDILNILFSSKKHCYLPDIYNNIGLWVKKKEEIADILPKVKLIHFANHPKPWSVLWQYESRPYMEDIYDKYEKISPWKDYPLELPRVYRHQRYYAEIMYKKGEYRQSAYWYCQYLKNKIKQKLF